MTIIPIQAVIALVSAIAHAPSTKVVVEQSGEEKQVDMFIELFLVSEGEQPALGRSLLAQLTSLNRHIDIYLSKLNKQSSKPASDDLLAEDQEASQIGGEEEEGLAKLLEVSREACQAIEQSKFGFIISRDHLFSPFVCR